MSAIWERRIVRFEELQKIWPFAQQILRFLRAVTSFQQQVYHRAVETDRVEGSQLDMSLLLSFYPSFLALVEKYGPPDHSALAQKLRDRPEGDWEKALRAVWNRTAPSDSTATFFPKALLQPYTMRKAEQWRTDVGVFDEGTVNCPFCDRPPVVSVLTENEHQEEVLRSLLCSLCSTEWSFPRIKCPRCQETTPEKLPRYTTPEIPWMRIEGCETCRHYVKAIDVRKNPSAVPVVDDLGSTIIDCVAREHNYTRLELNLVGV